MSRVLVPGGFFGLGKEGSHAFFMKPEYCKTAEPAIVALKEYRQIESDFGMGGLSLAGLGHADFISGELSLTTNTSIAINLIAVACIYVKWDEDPNSQTHFAQVGGITDDPRHEAGIDALKDSLRETALGLPFDLLPRVYQDQLVEHVIIMQLTNALKRRDKQMIWLNLGILHAFIGKPLHFLVEFRIDDQGHHDPGSMEIGANDYATLAEAYAGYANAVTRVRNELHATGEVYSERGNPFRDFGAVFGNRANLDQPRTVLHRH